MNIRLHKFSKEHEPLSDMNIFTLIFLIDQDFWFSDENPLCAAIAELACAGAATALILYYIVGKSFMLKQTLPLGLDYT